MTTLAEQVAELEVGDWVEARFDRSDMMPPPIVGKLDGGQGQELWIDYNPSIAFQVRTFDGEMGNLLTSITRVPRPIPSEPEVMSDLHTIDFVHSEDVHTLTFTCKGDETSDCHNYPSCDCEFWGKNHEHPKEPHTDCWIASWFTENGSPSCYVGADSVETCSHGFEYCPPETRSGSIDTFMEDECLHWEWAEKAGEA